MTATELREIRRALKLSQKDFALQLGIHQVTLANYERARYPIPQPIALAVAWIVSHPSTVESPAPSEV